MNLQASSLTNAATVDATYNLATTSKGYLRGTHRVVRPAETVARARAIAGPLGITRVANVTGLDHIGIPVVMVCRPNARSLSVSQGKGSDIEAARASGLMEAIELYHAERIALPLLLATWNELRFNHDLIDIEGIARISASEFHANLSLLWIEGVDLYRGKPIWLPYELVHMNFTLPLPSGNGCFTMSSNGLASGNHPLEAICHGLCEVVERDAATLFRMRSLESQAQLRLDLDTVDDPDCRRVLRQYEDADIQVGVWDITSDVGLPAYRCVIVEKDPDPFRKIGPVDGMGCHPAREVALMRALTEAAQGRLTLIAGSRDDNGRTQFTRSQDLTLLQRARERLMQRGTHAFSETPTHVHATFEQDLHSILSGLQHAGVSQAVIVDLTKKEFGIPVIRAVIPGLETYHLVPGYVPGPRAQRLLRQLAVESPQ